MPFLKVRTKNKVDIDEKPRVYFTCHPDDFEKCFKKICDDIFKTHDCAIYYTEDMTAAIAEDERDIDLGRNNLFVIPVTLKLLTTPSRAIDEDTPYALKEHIPVLPIMMEAGIEEFYSKPDKFGELQYLNRYSTDLTEIPYEEKLKKYLESVLISKEMAERIRKAFDAYIFLSYRKKDRKYANALIRLIHSNPECRDIAIWFDEFLTPGENFKKNIEKILDDCKLFTLIVTPHLFEKVVDENGEEKDNFVVSTELPLARKKKVEKGTDIFAVEMEETDKGALSAIRIEDYVNYRGSAFRARLLDAISHIAVDTNNSPEHNFLIGLAYLEGIDVEVDRERGIELITNAAEANLPEAMKKLKEIFFAGNGVEIDWSKAKLWSEKNANYCLHEYGEEDPKTIFALSDLVSIYLEYGIYKNAFVIATKLYTHCCNAYGRDNPCTIAVLELLCGSQYYLGNYKEAINEAQEVYDYYSVHLGEHHQKTIFSLLEIATIYVALCDYSRAIETFKRIYNIQCAIFGDIHCNIAIVLGKLGIALVKNKQFDEGLDCLKKSHQMFCELLGKTHPYSLAALSDIAYCYVEQGLFIEAIEIFVSNYMLQLETLGQNHPDTLRTLNNIGYLYVKRGNVSDLLSAQDAFEQVFQARSSILGSEHPDTLTALCNLMDVKAKIFYAIAILSFNEAKYEISLQNAKKLYEIQTSLFGDEKEDIIETLVLMAAAAMKLKRYGDAVVNLTKAYDLQSSLEKNCPMAINILSNLVWAYLSDEDIENAVKTSEIIAKTEGPIDPDSADIIALLFEAKGFPDKANLIRKRSSSV